MGLDEIWEQLAPETRDWLIANNGDAIPADIAAELDDLLNSADADDVWAVDDGIDPIPAVEADDESEDRGDDHGARYLTDDAVDWIEAAANDE